MSIEEASENYQIPMEILKKYETWGLCGEAKKVIGAWQYDDQDLEHLSTIMTLYDAGFENQEIEWYMKLLLEGSYTESERLKFLERRRKSTLDEIHLREKQLDYLDHLRYEIRKNQRREER